MYLYKKSNKSITIYDFTPDKLQLIAFKKKYLENIKSVIVHLNNSKTRELLYKSSTVLFEALDRRESNGRKTYIEETKNEEIISNYIKGKYDSLDPINIIGGLVFCKSLFSGELNVEDSTLLFSGGHYYNGEYITDEGILLTGLLAELQPLLSDDINNLYFSQILEDLDSEVVEFLKLFKCDRKQTISLDSLKVLQEKGLIEFKDDFYDTIEKSEEVLSSLKKVKKLSN